jgi:protein SCO1
MQAARRCLPLLLAALLACACGSNAIPAADVSAGGLQGLVLRPEKAAPALRLPNYAGGPTVSLAALRGKAVFVTFVYTHCPDVCPLIVASLATAQRRLGSRAAKLAILAVTVDPRGDTPVAIRSFLAARDATGRMDYLIGRRPALLRTWKRWGVGVTLGRNQVLAGHSSVIYGITASGRMAVVYPANVTPGQLDHDVPLLARS